MRKPIRVIRFSDKYDLRFEDRGFDVKLLLEVALLFELEITNRSRITIRTRIAIRSRIIRSLVTIKSRITIRYRIRIWISIIDRNRNTARNPINIQVR